MKNKQHVLWALPLLLFALFAPFSHSIDLAVTRAIYEANGGAFQEGGIPKLFYDYGPILPVAVMYFACLMLILSWIRKDFRPWRGACYCMLLVYMLGAGLIINGGLKEFWGRPRPKQCVEFGGEQAFRPFYKPHFGNPIESKSFSCGHCSVGFFFFVFYVLGRRYQMRRLAYGGLLFALIFGGFLSYARLVQGGHFVSDILASCLIMWLTALAVDRIIFEEPLPSCKA